MKRLFDFIKPDGVQIVLLIGMFVVLVVSVSMKFFGNDSISVKYQEELETKKENRVIDTKREIVRLGEDDSGLRYAEKLKEASALGTSLALYVVNERIKDQNSVSNIANLMQGFATNDLLPPQMQILYPSTNVDYGLVKSQRGTYFVRFRAKPLLIEILSPANTSRDESFLIRTPDVASARQFGALSEAGNWASCYIAPRGDAKIPAPFSSSEVFLQFGWRLEPLRFSQLTPEQAKTVEEWLFRQR